MSSKDEFSAYISAGKNLTTLLSTYSNSSCKNNLASQFSPNVTRKSYITCVNNVVSAGKGQADGVLLTLNNVLLFCQHFQVTFNIIKC